MLLKLLKLCVRQRQHIQVTPAGLLLALHLGLYNLSIEPDLPITDKLYLKSWSQRRHVHVNLLFLCLLTLMAHHRRSFTLRSPCQRRHVHVNLLLLCLLTLMACLVGVIDVVM